MPSAKCGTPSPSPGTKQIRAYVPAGRAGDWTSALSPGLMTAPGNPPVSSRMSAKGFWSCPPAAVVEVVVTPDRAVEVVVAPATVLVVAARAVVVVARPTVVVGPMSDAR